MTKPMSNEFKALKAINEVMEPLTDAERERVLEWAQKRYVGSVLDIIATKERAALGEVGKVQDAYLGVMDGLRKHLRDMGGKSLLDLINACQVVMEQAERIEAQKAHAGERVG